MKQKIRTEPLRGAPPHGHSPRRCTRLAGTTLLLALAACGPPPDPPRHDSGRDPPPVEAAATAGPQVLGEMGRIAAVEDSGYPFFTLRIEFPERGFAEQFVLDASTVAGADPASLAGWQGRYARFEYTSELRPALLDLRQEGRSLTGADDPGPPAGARRHVGVLGGASEPTAGDRPSRIRVHDPEGASIEFEFFVTPAIAAAEGSIVEAWFEERTVNRIVSIRPLAD